MKIPKLVGKSVSDIKHVAKTDQFSSRCGAYNSARLARLKLKQYYLAPVIAYE